MSDEAPLKIWRHYKYEQYFMVESSSLGGLFTLKCNKQIPGDGIPGLPEEILPRIWRTVDPLVAVRWTPVALDSPDYLYFMQHWICAHREKE